MAGIVMMFPSLRGGNENPGNREGLYGEVDDVIAPGDFLARQPYVDPTRVYLGGHSTGGTLVLLAAEMTARFRVPREKSLRTPALWLSSIHSPVFIIEGDSFFHSNVDQLEYMRRHTSNPTVQFFPVAGANHFTVLGPSNGVIAQKILKDTGPTMQIALTKQELSDAVSRAH